MRDGLQICAESTAGVSREARRLVRTLARLRARIQLWLGTAERAELRVPDEHKRLSMR